LASTKSRGSNTSASTTSYSTAGSVSTRSSISLSSSSKQHRSNPSASYTSSIPSISEWSESPDMYRTRNTANRPQALTRSISDYALRDHALGVQSFPRQELFDVSTPVYFCVHCGNGFEKRGDWETHEWIFHERQSYWPCPQSGCEAVFDSGKSFEAHHEVMHFCDSCKHSAECVRLLPERKVWACGFDGCKAVFLDWSKRCKHVASHYEGLARRLGSNRETPDWKYTTTVRNLLRQPDTRENFKKFMIKCHGHSKAVWPTLEWQQDSSAELKRWLEYREFPNGVGEIVQQAYRLGHPAHAAAMQVMSRPPTPSAEEISYATLSPTDAYFGSTKPRSRSQRSYLYERKTSNASSGVRSVSSDNRLYQSANSLPSSPPSASPPRTRTGSVERAGSFTSETASLASSRRTGRKRLVARDAEVRNTSCSALSDFLRDGPPASSQETPQPRKPRAPRMPPPVPSHRELVARIPEVRDTENTSLLDILQEGQPSASPAHSQLVARQTEARDTRDLTLVGILQEGPPELSDDHEDRDQELPLPRSRSMPRLPPNRTVVSPFPDYVDDGASLPWPSLPERPQITVQEPLEDLKPVDRSLAARRQKPQLREIKVRETILTLPRSSSLTVGTRVLPPTPGPPPMQALPKAPAILTLSPLSISSNNISDSPISPMSATSYSFAAQEPPPSPMPLGFEDMKWPLPPTPIAGSTHLLDSIPTPTAQFFREITPTPGSSFSTRRLAISPVEPESLMSPERDRPRTGHGLRVEVPKLMAAPPKRSRSMRRGSSRSGKRWTSISSLVEPPLPSPGVDFRFCLSQPLDLVGPPSISK
jgi:hypothetical protein